MGERREFEMSREDLDCILDACTPVPCIMLQCGMPPSPQITANAAWARPGEKMGFDGMTVEPVREKGNLFFTAIPKEN